MKCKEIESWMIDYLDNTIDQGRRSEIEKHLETCEKCLDDLRECQEMTKLTQGTPMEKPGENIRINFYHMLHNEIHRSASGSTDPSERRMVKWFNNAPFLAAAGVALLLCGAFTGMLVYSQLNKSTNPGSIEQLQAQVTGLRKDALMTMLREESSSNRIQGVRYTDDMEQPDDMVIAALFNTLNYDRNVNVRLAAAYSLAKFTGERMVCDSLVASLSGQTDPILQITLINILVEIKEKSALKTIEKIVENEATLAAVKAVAEKGAMELML